MSSVNKRFVYPRGSFPFRNKGLHTQLTSYVTSAIHYIHLYKTLHRILLLRCELQISTLLFPATVYLESEMNALSAVGNTVSLTPKIIANVRSTIPKSLVPLKNNRHRTHFPNTRPVNYQIDTGGGQGKKKLKCFL